MATANGRCRSETIAPLAYLVVWVLVLIVFWRFAGGAGAMGFTLVFLWGVLPLATVIVSLAIGLCDSFGRWKWLGPLVFGVMYMLAEYGTFADATCSGLPASYMTNSPELTNPLLGVAEISRPWNGGRRSGTRPHARTCT